LHGIDEAEKYDEYASDENESILLELTGLKLLDLF
jgi:hypothetical protein